MSRFQSITSGNIANTPIKSIMSPSEIAALKPQTTAQEKTPLPGSAWTELDTSYAQGTEFITAVLEVPGGSLYRVTASYRGDQSHSVVFVPKSVNPKPTQKPRKK